MVGEAVEIITGRERRRRWSVDEKLRVVAELYESGACVKQVAARHDIYPGLLFAWRRQAREGKLVAEQMPVFVPVQMLSDAAPSVPAEVERPEQSGLQAAGGRIEIELKDGSRVRVDGGFSLVSLRRVLAALRG